jgi:hypothetical protein
MNGITGFDVECIYLYLDYMCFRSTVTCGKHLPKDHAEDKVSEDLITYLEAKGVEVSVISEYELNI